MQLRLRHSLRSTLAVVALATLGLPFVASPAAVARVAQAPKGFDRRLVLARAASGAGLALRPRRFTVEREELRRAAWIRTVHRPVLDAKQGNAGR